MRQRNKTSKINKATADRGILMSYKDARDERLSNPVEIGFLYGAIVLTIVVGTIVVFPTQWRDVIGLSGLTVVAGLGLAYLLGGFIIISIMRTSRGKRLRTFGIVAAIIGCLIGFMILADMAFDALIGV